MVTLKARAKPLDSLCWRVKKARLNPQLETPHSGSAGALTIVMGAIDNPIGEVSAAAVDHSPKVATERNNPDEVRICSTARTRIPALA